MRVLAVFLLLATVALAVAGSYLADALNSLAASLALAVLG